MQDDFQSLEEGMLARRPPSERFGGTRVIVRGHGDTVFVRALLANEGRVAIVCKIEDHGTIKHEVVEGRMKPPTFGFPLEDVYEWSTELEHSKRPWDVTPPMAKTLGPERLERFIRGARSRRNRPPATK